MKKTLLKNSITIISALGISLLLIASILTSCTQEEIDLNGSYPNTIVEKAKISDKYRDFANQLAESTIAEFYNFTQVPRKSGNMDGIREFITLWAQANNKVAHLDPSGCLYIDLKPSAGHENDKNLIIQCHMDMVVTASKDYTEFDPNTTALNMVHDEEKGEIHGRDYKTNIGADDGQGLGLCMSLVKHENDFEHGPLRVLFTYDEETNMDGASKLSPEVLNADYLINFDNPRCGVALVGSAGFFPIEFTKKFNTTGVATNGTTKNLNIKVEKLTGGHSGLEIHLGRISASVFLIQYLNELKNNNIEFRLVSIECGESYNSIPNAFEITININKDNEEKAKEIYSDLENKLKNEHSGDSSFTSEIKVLDASGTYIDQQDSNTARELLSLIPNGITKMSEILKNDVESSNNVGIIRLKDGVLYCKSLFRSSNNETLKEQSQKIVEILKQYKADYEDPNESLGWAWPTSKTSLSNMYEKCMKEECGITPTIRSIHAGVETSKFYEKKPSMQLISIGGDVKDEHMLTETMYTKTFPVAVVPVIYIIEHINEL